MLYRFCCLQSSINNNKDDIITFLKIDSVDDTEESDRAFILFDFAFEFLAPSLIAIASCKDIITARGNDAQVFDEEIVIVAADTHYTFWPA